VPPALLPARCVTIRVLWLVDCGASSVASCPRGEAYPFSGYSGASLRCALFVSSEPQPAAVIVIRRGTEIVKNRQGARALSGQVRHYPCALVGGLRSSFGCRLFPWPDASVLRLTGAAPVCTD